MQKDYINKLFEKQLKERMSAWWDHEIIDRPVLAYSYRKFNFKRRNNYDNWGLAKDFDNIEAHLSNFINYIQNRHYGGEEVPNFWPNYGPGIMASVLGITPVFQNGTVWFDRPTDIHEIVGLLESAKINDNNIWFSRLCKITQYAAERSNCLYSVGISDIGGVLDILSSFLGPKTLIVNMRRNPGIIDECRAIILEKMLKVYDELQKIVDSHNLGSNSWLGVWCPKHSYPMQCDFSAMLSPRWFKRFVIPDLVAQAEHMDYSIYHLDGPNQLMYVNDLIKEPSITGIQWVPGIGEAAMESDVWFSLYRKVQQAGKNLVIASSPFSLARLYKNLNPKGLYVQTRFASKIDRKLFLPKFLKGWGCLFENKTFKSVDNALVVKSKARLKIINKFS